MNDFTKEELENLQYGIFHLISVGSCDSDWNKEIKSLKNKLQLMIEDYCEHDMYETSAMINTCCHCHYSEFLGL